MIDPINDATKRIAAETASRSALAKADALAAARGTFDGEYAALCEAWAACGLKPTPKHVIKAAFDALVRCSEHSEAMASPIVSVTKPSQWGLTVAAVVAEAVLAGSVER